MADDMYGGMSLESLGSSLLEKKEKKEKAAAKAAKKNDNIQKALALMLGAQTIFKGAYNRRAKELEAKKTFDIANNENQAKEMRDLSYIVESIPANYMPDATVEERSEAFYKTENYDLFKQRIRNVVDAKFKQTGLAEQLGFRDFNDFKQSSTYDNQFEVGARNFAKEYLTDNRYMKFENELQNLFKINPSDRDLDRIDLFKRAQGLTAHKLTVEEKRYYSNKLEQYRRKGNLVGGVKEVLSRLGLREQEEGGVNPFKAITEQDLLGPKIEEVMSALNINGIANTVVDTAMMTKNISDVVYSERTQTPDGQKARERLDTTYLPQMSLDFESKNYSTKDNPVNMVSAKNFEEIINDIKKDQPAEYQKFLMDATAINYKLKEDDMFAKNVYLGLEGAKTGELTYSEFKSNLDEEGFRMKLGVSMALTEGSYDREGLFAGYGYRTVGVPSVIYDRYSGSIPLILGEGIKRPTINNNNFTVTKEYRQFSKDLKVKNYDMHVENILKTNLKNETAREVMLNKLFTQIPNPLDLTQEEYLERLAREALSKLERTDVAGRKEILERIPTEFQLFPNPFKN